jgi:hypothetical protein
MSIKVLFHDLRTSSPQIDRQIVDWWTGMRADEVIKTAFSPLVAEKIFDDLYTNNYEITVSWLNDDLDQRSEVGGVASLDWAIPDRSTLIITYQNNTTSQDSIDTVISWMMKDEDMPW